MRRPAAPARPPTVLILAASALALLLAACAVGPVVAQSGSGIGVAPSTLRIQDPPLVRGGTMERVLTFQQHDYDVADVEIRVLPPGGDARDASAWVTVDPAGEVRVPRTAEYPVTVRIVVPADAANGEYRAKVEFRVLQACDSAGSCAAVQTAASSVLVMEVSGEQIKRIRVLGSPEVRDAEEGGSLQYMVPLENIGNVNADPHIRLEISDKLQTQLLRTYWSNQTILRPGESGRYVFVEHGIDLTPDQYWGVVTVFLDGVNVQRSNAQTFDVLEPGSLARSAVLKTIRIDGAITTAAVGDLVKLQAVVQNTGQAPILAAFKGEVYVDGRLDDTFESDVREIAIGATETIDLIYRVQKAGQHEFKGRAYFGSKVTEEKTLLLQVGGEAAGTSPLVLGGAALGILGLVGAGVFIVKRRNAARSKRPARAPVRRGPAPPRPTKGAPGPTRGPARPGAPGRPPGPPRPGQGAPPRGAPPGRPPGPPPARQGPPPGRPSAPRAPKRP